MQYKSFRLEFWVLNIFFIFYISENSIVSGSDIFLRAKSRRPAQFTRNSKEVEKLKKLKKNEKSEVANVHAHLEDSHLWSNYWLRACVNVKKKNQIFFLLLLLLRLRFLSFELCMFISAGVNNTSEKRKKEKEREREWLLLGNPWYTFW
jgi:hypothetical protein